MRLAIEAVIAGLVVFALSLVILSFTGAHSAAVPWIGAALILASGAVGMVVRRRRIS